MQKARHKHGTTLLWASTGGSTSSIALRSGLTTRGAVTTSCEAKFCSIVRRNLLTRAENISFTPSSFHQVSLHTNRAKFSSHAVVLATQSHAPTSGGELVIKRRYTKRRVLNTSETGPIREFWETKGKKWLTVGAVGIVAIPAAIVGGLGYGIVAAVRYVRNRIGAYRAGSSLAQYEGRQGTKPKKKAGFFSKMIVGAMETDICTRLSAVLVLNEDPEALTKIGPAIELDMDKDHPSGSDLQTADDGNIIISTCTFYVKSKVSGKEALVTAECHQSSKDMLKYDALHGSTLPSTAEEMDARLHAHISSFHVKKISVEVQDTGEEFELKPSRSRDKTTTTTTTTTTEASAEEEVEEVEEGEEGEAAQGTAGKRTKKSERKKRKKGTVIDVPFAPRS